MLVLIKPLKKLQNAGFCVICDTKKNMSLCQTDEYTKKKLFVYLMQDKVGVNTFFSAGMSQFPQSDSVVTVNRSNCSAVRGKDYICRTTSALSIGEFFCGCSHVP